MAATAQYEPAITECSHGTRAHRGQFECEAARFERIVCDNAREPAR